MTKRGRPKRQPTEEQKQATAVLRRLRALDTKREYTTQERITLVRMKVLDPREARFL